MKYCNEDVGKWSLPCGYPRQWLDGGGCLVDDEAPVGTPCRIGPDGLPVRDHDGRIMSPVNAIFAAPNSGGGCHLPSEARRLLAETPVAKAVICQNPNGSRFVRVFTSPDVADCVCPDWTHEDFCERGCRLYFSVD